jgi:bifunctional enzyme CysN/CysC
MSSLIDAAELAAPLVEQHARKTVLRVITCGSVDDGKSTLIGRLLHDTGNVHEDQLATLKRDSVRFGTRGDAVDFALLLDGLSAEREQGITIDVAYRYFSTPTRQFIVADCPGHVQYTRNMATGASTTDAAIVLVDARKGVIEQTERHTRIVAEFGVQEIVLAVNKMDLVDYDAAAFAEIERRFRKFAASVGVANIHAIPVAAVHGDNLLKRSARTSWYRGPSLLQCLEQLTPQSVRDGELPLVLPVQWIARPNAEFRGIAGRIASGTINVGQSIVAFGSSTRLTTVREILRGSESVRSAHAGDSVMVRVHDELDISRGDVLAATTLTLHSARALDVRLLGLSETALNVGDRFALRLGTAERQATLQSIVEAPALALNALVGARLTLDRPLWTSAFVNHRALGALVLIDRFSHATVAGGTVRHALAGADQPASLLVAPSFQITAPMRAAQKQQTPYCVWFTGVSGAGKSTLANALDVALTEHGQHVAILDGDALRATLSPDLGFTESDRREHVRRVAAVALCLLDAGLIVLVSVIAPYRDQRAAIAAQLGRERLIEVWVRAQPNTLRARDPKGLYRRAAAGEIQGLTGHDALYEAPLDPALIIDTDTQSINEALAPLLAALRERSHR